MSVDNVARLMNAGNSTQLEQIAHEVTELQNTGVDTTARAAIAPFVLAQTNIYNVGAYHTYATISAAIAAWISDNKPQAEIIINTGEYNEAVALPANCNITFTGASKELVVWRTKTGMYDDAPLSISGGTILVQNITFVSDHTDNAEFDYAGNPEYPAPALYQCAYAVHVDGGDGGLIVVKNCDLISYQDAAFGCGTVDGTILRLENCNLYSYTDTVDDFPNAALALTHGALLYHTEADSASPTEFEGLELINISCYTKNSPQVIAYKNYSSDGSKKNLLAINVNVGGGQITAAENLIIQTSTIAIIGSKYTLDKNSGGNNCDVLNAYKVDATLDGIDADAIIGNGRFFTNVNTPTTSVYFVEQTSYGNYKYQLASKMSTGETYRRSYNNGTWGSWISIDNPTSLDLGYSTLVTDCNAIASSGFFQTGVNCTNAPTTSSHHIISHRANANYAYQWSIKMTDNSIQYKRTLNNGTWTEWAEL